MRSRRTKLIHPDHRLPPTLIEDAVRERSNRMLRGILDVVDTTGRRGSWQGSQTLELGGR